MWVRAMETYDRVAKAGMGDGWSGNGYYLGNPHLAPIWESIKQAANVW